MAVKGVYPNGCIQGERRSKGRGERKQVKNSTHTACAEETRAVCTCYSSSEEILFLCWDLARAPFPPTPTAPGTHIPQLMECCGWMKWISPSPRRLEKFLAPYQEKAQNRSTDIPICWAKESEKNWEFSFKDPLSTYRCSKMQQEQDLKSR